MSSVGLRTAGGMLIADPAGGIHRIKNSTQQVPGTGILYGTVIPGTAAEDWVWDTYPGLL